MRIGLRFGRPGGLSIQNDAADQWLKPAFAEAYRVLRFNRFCVCFYGWSKADKFLAAWRMAGFRPVGHLVFRKRYLSATHFLRYQHEQAYLLAKGSPSRPERGQTACAGSTWSPTLSVLRHREQTCASWIRQAARSGRS